MRLIPTIVLNVAMLFMACSNVAHANEVDTQKVYALTIAAQSRHDALIALGSQTDFEILFGPNAIPKGNTDGLHGTFSITEAITLLLSNSALTYRINKQQIRIEQNNAKATVLPKVTVQGYLRADSSRIVQDDDSQAHFPLYQVPLSIQSIPKAFMDEVQAIDVTDAIHYIGGVEFFESSGGLSPVYYSRGIVTPLSIDGKFYRRTLLPLDEAVLERIDLVQGPSANYMHPGGMLNLVTKKPQKTSQRYLAFTGGSYDFYRGEVDVNHSLSNEKRHSVRLIAAVEKEKHIKDFAFSEKYVFAPSMNIQVSQDSDISLSGYSATTEQFANTQTYHESLIGTRLPPEQTMSMPWSKAQTRDHHAAAAYTKENWYGWYMHSGIHWNYSHTDDRVSLIGPPINTQGDADIFYLHAVDGYDKTYGADWSIEKELKLFNKPSLLRLGLDYQYFDNFQIHYPGLTDIGDFNVYAPEYTTPQPANPNATGDHRQLTDFYSAYLSHSYYLSDRFTLYSDIRYEDMQFTSTTRNFLINGSAINHGRYREWTPRIGLNIDIIDDLSSHLSYAESFTYQGVTDVSSITLDSSSGSLVAEGNIVPPIKNRQYEFSLKKRWLDEQLSSNLTFYYIRRDSIQAFVMLTPFSSANAQAEDNYSKGASVNLEGKLSEKVKILANAAYNTHSLPFFSQENLVTSVSTNTPVASDKHLHSSAKRIANLWVNYQTTEQVATGLGIRYRGERYGDDQNTFKLASYSVVDATLDYKHSDKLSFAFALRNVFDKHYYISSLSLANLVEEGPPRSAYLTVTFTHGP